MKWEIFYLVVLIGLSYAEIDTENVPKIPDIDDVGVIKERCNKKGGAGTYERLKKAREETKTCIQGLIDINAVQNEVEEAKKTGSMDEVFGKYCAKRPQFKECLKKTVDVGKECMEDNEKDALNVTTNIFEQIGDFVCFRDGDRIAMFIAEGGVTCLKSRIEGIKDCVNSTFKINPTELSLNSLPSLTIDKQKCDDLTTLQRCVVKELEDNCKDSTPANIVDAMFKFVKKTACKNIKQKRSISLSDVALSRSVRSVMGVGAHYQLKMKEAQEQLKSSCRVNGGDAAFEKFTGEMEKTKKCVGTKLFLVTPKDEFLEHVETCAKDFISALEDCMPQKGKYYPQLAYKMIKSLFNFAYENKNALSDSVTSRQLTTCLRSVRTDENTKKVLGCIQEVNPNNTNGPNIVPPKEELCGKIKQFDACINTIISDACQTNNNVVIKDLITDFIAAIENPCVEKVEEKNF